MADFIKVADDNETVDFINLDLVTKVECSVKRIGASRGVDIVNLASGVEPEFVSTPARVTASIKLLTAGVHGTVRFQSLDEAEQWAKERLGISVSFNQL